MKAITLQKTFGYLMLVFVLAHQVTANEGNKAPQEAAADKKPAAQGDSVDAQHQNKKAAEDDGIGANASNTACNKDLLETYSLTGLDIPAVDKIEMCPSITRTCCLKQDQQIMFTNFIHGGEHQAVIDHYSKVTGAYYDLIEKLAEVQEFAKNMKNNIVKKIANCKLLAERILNYEVSQVQEQIRQNLAKVQELFETAAAGFYCTICNFDNHKYFDDNTKTIFFSEKFCRDIVERTLPSLLLFHVDIVKHANLVTKFVSSCDFTGTYNMDAVPPADFAFAIVNENMQDLQACRDNRNKREWFSYCKDICSQFQIVTFADYFQPNLALITGYTTYLTKTLGTLTQAQNSRPLFGALSTPKGDKDEKEEKKRILEEGEGEEEEEEGGSGKIKLVFKPGLSAKVDLVKWRSDFLPIGISYFDEGKNALINENTYNSVKTFLQILNSQNKNQGANVNNAGGPTTSQAEAKKEKTSGRRLKKAAVPSILGLVAMMFIAFFK